MHTVYIKVYTTDCGETDWMSPEPLEVLPPGGNSPPVFKVAWVDRVTKEPVTFAVEGDVLDLIYIEDDELPYDPDGDRFYFLGFHTEKSSSEFIRNLPNKYHQYDNGFHCVTMDTVGVHVVEASMEDEWGARSTEVARIEVVPRNPVPVITGPYEVKEKRPLTLSGEYSYSPVGRSISEYEWNAPGASSVSALDQKEITLTFDTPGKEEVTLDVVDSRGLRSLETAYHTVTVKPDLPPVPMLEFPPYTVRDQTIVFKETSYSPDGDQIVKTSVTMRYDSDNDGDLSDEPEQTIILDEKRTFTFQPKQIGKYYFTVYAEEDWGKNATDTFVLDVINDAPFVTFSMTGEVLTPPKRETYQLEAADVFTDKWSASTFGRESVGKKYLLNPDENSIYGNPIHRSEPYFNKAPSNKIKKIEVLNLGPGVGNGVFNPRDKSNAYLFPGYYLYYYFPSRGSLYDNRGVYLYNLDESADPLLHLQTYYSFETIGHYFLERWNDHIFTYDHGSLHITDLLDGKVITNDIRDKGRDGVPYNCGGVGIPESYLRVSRLSRAVQLPNGDFVCFTGWQNSGYDYYNTLYTVYLPFGAREIDRSTRKDIEHPSRPTLGGILTHNIYGDHFISIGSNNKDNFYKVDYRTGEVVDIIEWPFDTDVRGSFSVFKGFVIPHFSFYWWSEDGTKLIIYYSENHLEKVFVADAKTLNPLNSFSTYMRGNVDPVRLDTIVGVYNDTIVIREREHNRGRVYYAAYDLDFNRLWRMEWKGSTSPEIITSDGYIINFDPNGSKGDIRGNRSLVKIDMLTGEVIPWVDFTDHIFELLDISMNNLYEVNIYPELISDTTVLVRVSSHHRSSSGSESSNSYPPLVVTFEESNNSRHDFYDAQLMMEDESLIFDDFEVSWQSRFRAVSPNVKAGFAFRMQDHRNMYRLEYDRKKATLYKIVNGQKIVLDEMDYKFNRMEFASFRIRAIGDSIRVYINGAPLMNVQDSTFSSGTYGPYTDLNAEFKNMSITDMTIEKSMIPNVAVVRSPIDYHIAYDDPEQDPKIPQADEWTYVHVNTTKFLDAGDGYSGRSAHHNQTYSMPLTSLDKVGVYQVSYQATDDPHRDYRYPNNTFAEYREKSNKHTEELIVHRRPVSVFTVSQRSDGVVVWNDQSYDPDRWLSPTQYSREDTGIDYRTTRGVLERRYYYITPSGRMVPQQLVTPTEKGRHIVAMAVRDEYGAWSDWTEQTIDITVIPKPDEPPHAGFTTSHTKTYRGVPVTINSTAWDAEDGGRENLRHEYWIRNLDSNQPETFQSNSRTSWTKVFNSMGRMNIRQVVFDSLGQSDQAEKIVEIVNRLPVANVTTPSSTDQNKPTIFDVTRPTFRWNYSDGDGDPQTRFQVRIYRYGGILLTDSGYQDSSAKQWTPANDLPEELDMYVQVRVHDGFDWGEWSAPKFFRIITNKPPVADFDWTPKPVWEGDTVRLLPELDDPDDDVLQVSWRIVYPNGDVREFSQVAPPPYKLDGPTFRADIPGRYTITLTVSDGQAPPVYRERSLVAEPLSVTGAVLHTPEWEAYRLEYNKRYPDRARSADTFWAGEQFVLQAVVTDTRAGESGTEQTDGSVTVAEEVEVTLLSEKVTVFLESRDKVNWNGMMWEEDFEDLEDGKYTFRFPARWSNGVVKTDEVDIWIRDSMWSTVGVFRRR